MAKETRPQHSEAERHTGNDSVVKFEVNGTKYELPVTSVDWSRDENTNDIQHNDSLNPVIATTGLRYSGSFEYTGRNWDAMNKLIHGVANKNDDGDVVNQRNESVRGTLTVQETTTEDGQTYTYTYTFKRVKVTSNSRSVPSDDSSSSSYDWSAEDMIVLKNGSQPSSP